MQAASDADEVGLQRSTKHQEAGRDNSGCSLTRRPLFNSDAMRGTRPRANPAPSMAAAMTWLKLLQRTIFCPKSRGNPQFA